MIIPRKIEKKPDAQVHQIALPAPIVHGVDIVPQEEVVAYVEEVLQAEAFLLTRLLLKRKKQNPL